MFICSLIGKWGVEGLDKNCDTVSTKIHLKTGETRIRLHVDV